MVARATSDEAKKARGTFKPSRERRVPQLKAATPDMPEGLPESAQKVWRRLVPQLAEAKLLTELDQDVLVLYCTRMGAYLEDWGTSAKAADITQLRLLMADLGLTPAARLKTPPLEDDSEEQWIPQNGGNVVSISQLLSGTPRGSSPEKSRPVDTSASPASDS